MEIKTKNRVMNGSNVTVIASRFDATSRWTIKVDVVTADGNRLPRMSDDDHSYSELEEAFEAGFNLL